MAPPPPPAPKPSGSKPRHCLYLVDGSGYIFRAYHALPPLSRKRDGLPVGAVAGFCNMLVKLLEAAATDGAVSHLAVVFDHGRKTFRNDLYPAYKANRDEPPEDLVPQFPLVRDAVRAFSVAAVEVPNFEADDVIASYARAAAATGADVVIVSSDKDLMQLVGMAPNGARVSMLDPVKERAIDAAEVLERFGVPPEKVVDVQALAGDSTDNVPGVPGIGVKTAAELINAFGDLDTLLARAHEIKQPKRRENLIQFADQARLSRDLVRLRDDVELATGLDAMIVRPIEPAKLFKFLDEMEFARLRARIESKLAQLANPGAETPPLVLAEAKPEPAAEQRRDYVLVQDLAQLDRWIEEARLAGVVAVDTETTSLDATQARLVGVSLCVNPGRACYIPLGHSAGTELDLGGDRGAIKQIKLDAAMARLQPLLADPTVLKVGQNIKYDMVVLARYGAAITPVDDTMMISCVLEGGLHGHGMDELALLHLGFKPISFTDVAGAGKARVTFDQVPLDKACEYAAEDADVTMQLHRALKPRLVRERLTTLYETIERPLISVIVAMERAGIKVDRAELHRLSGDFARRMAELEQAIHKLAGREFNVGSPKQLGEVLFDQMSLAGGKRGKTGAYGTGADVLEALAAQGHDLPKLALEWRQLQKLKGTYTDALAEQINPETGRVHTSFHLAATSTGRLASSDPNLQNIPIRTEEGRKIRRAFIAEPGFQLLSADYSQIELRLLAHVAEIEPLKQAFRDGVDIHALTASQVFGGSPQTIDPGVRRAAKAINFGIIYGMSAFGLSQQLNIPQKAAQAYIDAYMQRFPGIRAYMDATKAQARALGYVTTLFGRRCHTPGINSKNPAERAGAERAAINAPLQGAAADIIKRAMVRVAPALAEAGLDARMLLQVHDELVFEVAERDVAACSKLVRKCMEGAARLSVPMVVEIGVAANWEEAH